AHDVADAHRLAGGVGGEWPLVLGRVGRPRWEPAEGQLPEAARLYAEAGWSLGRLGRRYGGRADTLARRRREGGVEVDGRGGTGKQIGAARGRTGVRSGRLVRVHGLRVTAFQLRTMCGSIKADLTDRRPEARLKPFGVSVLRALRRSACARVSITPERATQRAELLSAWRTRAR